MQLPNFARKKQFWLTLAAAVCALVLCFGLYFFHVWQNDLQKQAEQAKLVQQYRDNKFAAYTAENEQYADYEVDVAFLGDSLTDGYPLQTFYPQFTVVNRGIGGDTTHTLYDRLQISVLDLKPKVVVMLIGGNNLTTMFENYEDILRTFQLQLPETKIVLLSLTSMSRDWAHKNEIAALNNVKIKLLAQQYGYTFVDLFTPLFDLPSGMLKAEYTTDGVHLTLAGYEVVTAAVTPVLEGILSLEKAP